MHLVKAQSSSSGSFLVYVMGTHMKHLTNAPQMNTHNIF